MSKQDSHFFNNFSLVLGILFAVTLGLFAFARHIGAKNQLAQVSTDPRYLESVEQRLQPVARVAVSGQDNTAMKIESAGPPMPVAAVPQDGAAAYHAAWGPRIAQGKATLYEHALKGFNGKTGVMPAKGGRADWPDDLIKQAVDHIVELNK
jgi:cytochrome c5